MRSEHIARTALALAGVAAEHQRDIIHEVGRRLGKESAIVRRNYWLRTAFDMLGAAPGNVRLLADAINRYETTTWLCVRHLAEPRPTDSPLQQAFFLICQAAEDAGTPLPGERQIRRLVT